MNNRRNNKRWTATTIGNNDVVSSKSKTRFSIASIFFTSVSLIMILAMVFWNMQSSKQITEETISKTFLRDSQQQQQQQSHHVKMDSNPKNAVHSENKDMTTTTQEEEEEEEEEEEDQPPESKQIQPEQERVQLEEPTDDNYDKEKKKKKEISYSKNVTDLNTIDDKERLDEMKALARAKAQPIPSVVGGVENATILYNPEEFRLHHNLNTYVNLPIQNCEEGTECWDELQKALTMKIETPYGLKHKAHPSGSNVIMGLAAYPPGMEIFRAIIGVTSLRATGYDGHIILGVHEQISPKEETYLQLMNVTYYTTSFIPCDPSILTKADLAGEGNTVRAKCSPGLTDLKLEWGRFEMSRQWLHDCSECTGWAMTMDTRDAFFQTNPFTILEQWHSNSQNDNSLDQLYFVEELAPHTDPFYGTHDENRRHFTLDTDYRFYQAHTDECYGKNHQHKFGPHRPVLCSGTILGTRKGLHRFLSVLVYEFRQNNQKSNEKCRSPHTTDQWTMNYLYYSGRFGYPQQTKTLPYGTGPVLTVGKACTNRAKISLGQPSHSAQDIVEFVQIPQKNNNNNNKTEILIRNPFESETSPAYITPCVHQYDRCYFWVNSLIRKQFSL